MGSVAWLKNALDLKGSRYHELHHAKAFTAQEIAEREHVSGHHVAKTVAVRVDDKTLLLVLPASRRVSFSALKMITGAKVVRLLSEGEIAFEFSDCEVGAIPPLRHWPSIDVWVDSTLGAADEILFDAGTHESAIRMKYSDWRSLVAPREESFTEPLDSSSSARDDDWRDTAAAVENWEIGQGD